MYWINELMLNKASMHAPNQKATNIPKKAHGVFFLLSWDTLSLLQPHRDQETGTETQWPYSHWTKEKNSTFATFPGAGVWHLIKHTHTNSVIHSCTRKHTSPTHTHTQWHPHKHGIFSQHIQAVWNAQRPRIKTMTPFSEIDPL